MVSSVSFPRKSALQVNVREDWAVSYRFVIVVEGANENVVAFGVQVFDQFSRSNARAAGL